MEVLGDARSVRPSFRGGSNALSTFFGSGGSSTGQDTLSWTMHGGGPSRLRRRDGKPSRATPPDRRVRVAVGLLHRAVDLPQRGFLPSPLPVAPVGLGLAVAGPAFSVWARV